LGHGSKLSHKQELAIAGLLQLPTIDAAAQAAGVSSSTMKRWLKRPDFRAGYRQARRELVEDAVGRVQAAAGQAVDTLLSIAKDGAKDGDRVRASVAILEHALRGIELSDVLRSYHAPEAEPRTIKGTADVVLLLADRLQQLEAAELPTAEKARLTATLADALLRALGVDVVDRRLEAIESVLLARKDKQS
jgi:hypothetical protein